MDLYDYKFKDREIMKIKYQLIRKGNKKIEEFMGIKISKIIKLQCSRWATYKRFAKKGIM